MDWSRKYLWNQILKYWTYNSEKLEARMECCSDNNNKKQNLIVIKFSYYVGPLVNALVFPSCINSWVLIESIKNQKFKVFNLHWSIPLFGDVSKFNFRKLNKWIANNKTKKPIENARMWIKEILNIKCHLWESINFIIKIDWLFIDYFLIENRFSNLN